MLHWQEILDWLLSGINPLCLILDVQSASLVIICWRSVDISSLWNCNNYNLCFFNNVCWILLWLVKHTDWNSLGICWWNTISLEVLTQQNEIFSCRSVLPKHICWRQHSVKPLVQTSPCFYVAPYCLARQALWDSDAISILVACREAAVPIKSNQTVRCWCFLQTDSAKIQP